MALLVTCEAFLQISEQVLVDRAGAMSLNQVVPNVANLKIGGFHSIKSQKSSGSIAPFSKIEWFHGTTGTTTNAGPVM